MVLRFNLTTLLLRLSDRDKCWCHDMSLINKLNQLVSQIQHILEVPRYVFLFSFAISVHMYPQSENSNKWESGFMQWALHCMK